MGTEVAAVIEESQNLVLSGFPAEGRPINLPAWVSHLKTIAEAPDDLVKEVLGSTGMRLKRFAIRVNLNHPDIESYFGMLGQPAVELCKVAAEALTAATADKSQGKEIVSLEKDFTANEGWVKSLRFMQQPNARLLGGLEDRKNQRGIKQQIKSVGLKSVFQGGENAFYGRPTHFKRFARGSSYYHEELKDLKARQDLFVAKNMPEMSHAFAKRMRSLEESVSDLLGFYRIKPDEAAVTLARLHGFKWNNSGIVTISSTFFDGCHFWSEGAVISESEEDKAEGMKKALILNTRFVPTNVGSVFFNYQPRMYPLSLWETRVSTPSTVQKIIDRSEHFALLNRSPFFDYYWVLVPSINIAHPLIQKQKDHYTVREGGSNVVYADATEAAFSVDTILVKEGCVVPIIIGERDGRCYFVSHWA